MSLQYIYLGVVGSLLGVVGGGLNLLLLKISGSSVQDVRYFQYGWKKARDDALHAVPRVKFHHSNIFFKLNAFELIKYD